MINSHQLDVFFPPFFIAFMCHLKNYGSTEVSEIACSFSEFIDIFNGNATFLNPEIKSIVFILSIWILSVFYQIQNFVQIPEASEFFVLFDLLVCSAH